MSYKYGFFDAVDLGNGNYDRVYSSVEFSHYWALLVGDGVFGQPSTSLNVLATTPVAMGVKVSPGTGWIKGHYLTVPDNMDEFIAIPVANPSLPRIDSIIMALDNNDRDMKLYVRSGTAAVSPTAVALQRDADVWELELAQITVAAGAGNITQQAIKDMRTDPNRCGIVTGLIDQFDVSGFFTAAQASFNEWFENVQGKLDGDVAGNLQNQIDRNAANIATINATTLKEDTKTALGLPTSAGPDDAFKVLANVGNLHVWEKSEKANPIVYSSSTVPIKLTSSTTYTFGRNLEIENGAIVLKNTFTAKGNENSSILIGCYFKKDGVVYRVGGFKTNTSTTTTWDMIEVSIDTSSYVPGNTIEYKTSTDASSYPADGVQDDYYYTYAGQLGNPGAKIEVGSYVGTGTYGSSNPNSLTFGFEPKMVCIFEYATDSSGRSRGTLLDAVKPTIFCDMLTTSYKPGGLSISQTSTGFNLSASNSGSAEYVAKKSSDGKTISWYCSDNSNGVIAQGNTSGQVYRYFAIG